MSEPALIEAPPLVWRRDVKLGLYVGRLVDTNRFLTHVDAVILRTSSHWFVIVIRDIGTKSQHSMNLATYKTKREAERGAERLVALRERMRA